MQTTNEQTPAPGTQSARDRRREAGFTLVEMLVTVILLSVVLVAALGLFDFNNRLAAVQTDVAEMQQSLRIGQLELVRVARAAGRGGLPVRAAGTFGLPTGLAVSVTNNVPINTPIGAGAPETVLEGTDVLTVRGVFSTPLYQVNNGNRADFVPGGGPGEPPGQIIIRATSPTGIPQDLTPLAEAIKGARQDPDAADGDPVPTHEALLLASSLQDTIYGVAELLPDQSQVPGDTDAPDDLVVLAFRYADSTLAEEYLDLSGDVFPPQLNREGSLGSVGILEEHRYYIREEFDIPGDGTSGLRPKLSRARVFPGTEIPYREDPDNWAIDIADNVFDLQVALGVDTNGDDTVADNGDDADEWLLNHPDDNLVDASWNGGPYTPPLSYLRVSTLVRSNHRDLKYQAPLQGDVEDRVYDSSSLLNQPDQRAYRRRALQTLVDLRNL